MSSQESYHTSRRDDETVEEAPAPVSQQPGAQETDDDTDDVLDEIDGVLEENAQEFVEGFVQKGGQ